MMFKKKVNDKDIDLAIGGITKAVANLEALSDRAEREAEEMDKEATRLKKLSVEQILIANRADSVSAKLRDLVS